MNTVSHSIELPYSLEFLATLNSENTRVAYRKDLEHFRVFLSLNGIELQRCGPEYIGVFRENLKATRSLNSINRALACLKSYFKFLIVSGLMDRNPMDIIKAYPSPEYTATPALSDEETLEILRAVDRSTAVGKRDYALLTLMFYLGPRNAEVRSLTIGSIQRDGDLDVLNIHGKGNKVRTLPLPDAVNTALQEYFHARILPRGENSPMFVSVNGSQDKPLSAKAIQRIFAKYAALAKIERRISPHSARATAVSNALENGASLLQAQHMGGWSSPDMPVRYDRRRQMIKNSAIWKVNYGAK